MDTVAVNNGCVGKYVVDTEGMYGVMAVYGDNITTAVKDGAKAGDVIHFVACQDGVEYPSSQTAAFTAGDTVEIPSQNAISSEMLGLYKDGEKIIDFELALPQEISEPAAIHKDKEAEARRLKRNFSNHLKDVKNSSGKFKEQKEFIEVVSECQEFVKNIKQKIEQGEAIESELDLLMQKEKDLVSINQEILIKFNMIEQQYRNKGCSKAILEKHTRMVNQHKKGTTILIDHLKDLKRDGDENRIVEKIDAIHNYFLENTFKEDPPLIHNQALPFAVQTIESPLVQKEDLESVRLKTGEYSLFSSPPPASEDLEPTIDIQFTDDIIDLADQLDHSPLKIYEYIKDNFEFEPYLGSRKGAHVTLIHRSGNDYDLASLLIALLRVSDIPARYATGIVEIPPDRIKNWLGVEDVITAGNILNTARMEAAAVVDGDQVVAIRCRRVWVEAYIPYTNYRGIRKDETGKMWVPLDCAFKQYDYQAGIDIPQEMAFDAMAFIDNYISTFHDDSPFELYKQQIVDYLAVHYPGLTYEEILRTKEIHPEKLGLIPGSLPYKLIAKDGEYAEIPDDKRYKIRFNIYGSGSSLDYTANLPEIAGKRVTVSYIGATSEDQQIIDDCGGIFSVESPWLVHVKPVLKVDGCDVAVGSGGVTMGISQNSNIHFIYPVVEDYNEMPVVYNSIIAGTYQGIGIDTWKVVIDPFAPPTAACAESYNGHLLHDTALRYLGRVDSAYEEVNKTMQMVAVKEVSLAIVEHVIDVGYSGGSPISFEWSGLRVDADRDLIGPFSVTGADESRDYMWLTGADNSISENRVFEDTFNEEAVSTIKILELASDMGIPIYKIDSSNINVILPFLTVPSHIKNAVASAVGNGRVVIIPRDNITYFDWTGTGYINMNPATCGAWYIISGHRNGGQTVNDWEVDPKASCINATINSISPAAANDLYCAEDTRYLAVDMTIHPYDETCNPLPEYNSSFSFEDPPNSMTIKDIADRYGTGVYTFSVGSNGGCPDCNMHSQSITIVKVEKIELVSGATMISEDIKTPPNTYICAAIKPVDGSGEVVVRAVLNPGIDESEVPDNLITWTGGQPVAGKQLERKVSKSTFAKHTLTAGCGGSHAAMLVYIIGAVPTDFSPPDGQSGAHFPDNSKGYKTTGILWPDPRTGITYSKCEIEFTVKPDEFITDGIERIFYKDQIRWDVSRDIRVIEFYKTSSSNWSIDDNRSSVWESDDKNQLEDEDNNPWDGQGHIYGNDKPWIWPTRFRSTDIAHVKKMNAREWVRVSLDGTAGHEGTRCSEYYPWHVFRSVRLDGTWINDDTYCNEIATGNIFWGTIPKSVIEITTTSLPNGRQNQPYTQMLSSTGGNAPFRWSLDTGSLPPGLTFSPSGIISGTPDMIGTFTFTVEAEDSSLKPFADLQTLSITIFN